MPPQKPDDADQNIRKAFTRQILTETPMAARPEQPAKALNRRNIILDEAMGPPAPKPAFKPRNIL